jgi:hypothetical protein
LLHAIKWQLLRESSRVCSVRLANNPVSSSAREPTLADVQHEFPAWECWASANRLVYARPKDKPPNTGHTVRGEDAMDLRDQIVRAESLGCGGGSDLG